MLLADLVPTTAHLPPSLDHGLRSLPHGDAGEQEKNGFRNWLRGHWLAIFAHDPVVAAAWLRERDGKVVAEPVEVD